MDEKNVLQRISDTRKETEELKLELQNLIKSGLGNLGNVDVNKEESIQPQNSKIQIIKSYDVKNSGHITKQLQDPNSHLVSKESKMEKVRKYDISEAREYMKKQRANRMLQSKAQGNEKLKAEERKIKLQELQKKTREIVEKNIHLKRARSKSNEKTEFVRLDPIRSRSVSRERRKIENFPVCSRSRTTEREAEPLNVNKCRARETTKSNPSATVKVSKKSPNVLYPPTPDYLKREEDKPNEIKTNKSNKIIILQNTTIKKCDIESSDINDKKEIKNTEAQIIESKSPIKNIFDYKNIEPVADGSNLPSTFKHKIANPYSGLINSSNVDEEEKRIDFNPEEVVERSTKETQTETKKEYPDWLSDQLVSHPLNFINTVKRKLQYSIKSPVPTTDIRIQNLIHNDFGKSSFQPNNEPGTTPRTSKQSRSEQSVLKSFISHKCLNLDADRLENYELVPKQIVNRLPTSVTLRSGKPSETESESDTSKNIPEISSESGTSLRKNAESVRRNLSSELDLAINTNKIDNMKLIPRNINTATATIYPDVNNYSKRKSEKETDKEFVKLAPPVITFSNHETKKANGSNYESDFDEESELDLSAVCSSKARDSILSFNSPENIVKCSSQILDPVAEDVPTSSMSRSTEKQLNQNIHKNLNIYSKNQELSPREHSKLSSGSTSIPELTELIKEKVHSTSYVTDTVTSVSDVLNERETQHSKSVPFSVNIRSNHSKAKKKTLNTNSATNTVSVPQNDDYKKSGSSTDVNTTDNSVINSIQSSNISRIFRPLRENSSFSHVMSKSDTNISYINTKRGSGCDRFEKIDGIMPLKQPTDHLKSKDNVITKNISIRSRNEDLNSTNELHLKFEAEIHLLNDYNESLRQFSAVEKVFESLKNNSQVKNSLQNNYTQTSTRTKSSNSSKGGKMDTSSDKNSVSTVNYSRGSFVQENFNNDRIESALEKRDTSSFMTEGLLDFSSLNFSRDSVSMKTDTYISNMENLSAGNFVGLSVNMFEQLIKDEDARLENLKTILKIREKVLLDRTRGELAWLEIQRKNLKETGKLQEASLIKKKQRGILVNHQKESHEMHRLKQMQKAASTERKSILKKQRNLIRQQLSTKNMMTNIKISTPRERRTSGPLKVIQSHTESLRSETSISKRNSSEAEKEVYSITSHQSVVSKFSELSGSEMSSRTNASECLNAERQSAIKRSLQTRQAALEKRKKAVEGLLQWHKRLVEEEKRIVELESTATAIIFQKPSRPERCTFTGRQLNQLWYNLTDSRGTKFADDKIYPMSQIALERFCKSASGYSLKAKKALCRTSDSDVSEAKIDAVISDNVISRDTNPSQSVIEQLNEVVSEYTSDFDLESIEDIAKPEDIDVVDQSINELIDNFSKIRNDISTLSIERSKSQEKLEEHSNRENRSDKTESEEEISVIETNKRSSVSQDKYEDIVCSSEKSEEIISALSTEKQTASQGKLEDVAFILSSDKKNTDIQEISEVIISDISFNKKESCEKSEDIVLVPSTEKTNSCQEIVSFVEEQLEDAVNYEQSRNVVSTLTTDGKRDVGEKSEDGISIIVSDQINRGSYEKSEGIASASSSEKTNSIEEKPEDIVISASSKSKVSEKNEDLNSTLPSIEDKVKSSARDIVSKELLVLDNLSEALLVTENENIPSTSSEKNTDSKEPLESATSYDGVPSEHVKTCSVSSLKDVETQSKGSASSTADVPSEKVNVSSEIIEETSAKSFAADDVPAADVSYENNQKQLSDEIVEEQTKSATPEQQLDEEPIKSDVQPSEIASEINDIQKEVESNKSDKTSRFVEDINKTSCDTSLSLPENHVSINNTSQIVSITQNDISNEVDSLRSEKETIRSSFDDSEKLAEENVSGVKVVSDTRQNTDTEVVEDETDIDEELSVDNIEKSSGTNEGAILEERNLTSDERKSLSQVSSDSKNEKSSAAISSTKEEVNAFEEKEQDSLSSQSTESQASLEKDESADKSIISNDKASVDKSTKGAVVDVKKRISEIMADTNALRGDKSPRLQDLYVTTYDLVSPASSPPGSPADGSLPVPSILFDNEAEEILRKQLAIEQEIKQITEQQQKEQLPFMFVREIPNKPPPPYTPPSSLSSITTITIIPAVDEIEEITKYSSKILYKAYLSNNLDNITISDNTLNLICKDITKSCYKFVFDLCKEICKEHYGQFKVEQWPPWLQVSKKPQLAVVKPLDAVGLEKYMCKKLKEIFGYEKPVRRENTIIKWSRKKRDHVDEILVQESQAEEAHWTNYDKDELLVMDQVTNEIMNMLLVETGQILNNLFTK